jgi:malonyl-CoA O-methyltransferase
MLQWCDPPDAVFAEVRRVLKPRGLFTFTSFGPDTLKELRSAWATVDRHVHVNRFIDMHDIGDAMMRAGLSDPVLDVEHLTLTYPEVITLMRELKALGAHNVTHGRRVGLTGRQALTQMQGAYERYRRDDVLPATYEVLYAQAWGPATRLTHNEVAIPTSSIGRRK